MSLWTESTVSRLLEHKKNGVHNANIAIKLRKETGMSFTTNAIIGKLHRLGSSKFHKREFRRERELREQNPELEQKLKETAKEKSEFSPKHIPLIDLENGQCRRPTIVEDGQQLFCGIKLLNKKSKYCKCHE